MEWYVRQVSTIIRSCNLQLNDDLKYEQFLATPEYYSWVLHNLNDFYAKGDYLLSFLLSDPLNVQTNISNNETGEKEVKETQTQLSKGWKLEDLNLKVDLESEFHFFFTRFASYVSYIKPTFYFISSGEILPDSPKPHVTCKRVIINLALLILFARAFNHSDTDIAEILSAVVLQFPQLFGVDDSRDFVTLYPQSAVLLFIYIILYQRIDCSTVDIERFESQFKGSFSLFEDHVVKQHRENFESCLKSVENTETGLVELIERLRKHYTLDTLRCHLVDLVQNHRRFVLSSNSSHKEALIPFENCIGLVFKYREFPEMEKEKDNSTELVHAASHVKSLKLQRQNALLSTALRVKNIEIEHLKNEIATLKQHQIPKPTERIVSSELGRLQSLLTPNGNVNGVLNGSSKVHVDESYLSSIKTTVESLLRYQNQVKPQSEVPLRLSDEEETFFEKNKDVKVEPDLKAHYESQFQFIYEDFLKKKQDPNSSLCLIPELQTSESNGSLKHSATYNVDTEAILENVGEPVRKQLKKA